MLVLIDSSALAYQSFFSLGNEFSYDEQDTGIIYGFLLQLLPLRKEVRSNDFVFCFDHPASFRKEVYPDYKNSPSRKKIMTDEEKKSFFKQVDLLRTEILPAFGFKNVFQYEGLEADDIIARICRSHSAVENITIISSDKDLLQCLGKNVKIYQLRKKKFYTADHFQTAYGIEAYKYGIVKGYSGCTTDAVPGCEKVGDKTAIKYLKGELKEDSKVYQRLKEYSGSKEHELTKELVMLPHKKMPEVEIEMNKFSKKGFFAMCEKYGLSSFENELLKDWRSFFTKKRKMMFGKSLV